ncbi:MAG: hypothetical protein WA988_05085, partial [Candidatus Nanopelagicales bacterium]
VAAVNPRMSKIELENDQPVTFVPMAAVSAESGVIDVTDVQLAGPLKRKSYRQFADGDVLVAKITPSMENGKGAVARGLANGRGFGSTEFHVLRPGSVDAGFLLRFLLQPSFRADAARNMTGTAGQLRVPPDYLRRHPIPVPPLPEQRRIVERIEEHFSRLDAAEASLEDAKRRSAALERTIFATANADQWPESPLGELLEGIEAGKSFKTPGRPAVEGEWGVVKVSAMTWGEFDPSQNKAVLSADRIDPRYEIVSGDLLLSRANTSELVGATVLVGACPDRLLLSDKSMRLLTKPGVDRQWLRYCLGSPSVRAQMSAVASGTSDSMRNISQSKVKALKVRFPPIDEQRRLADGITLQLRMAGELSSNTTIATSRSAALRQSILAAAFSGQLVPQDPAEEPAEVLLERITAERAAAKPTRKRKEAAS